MKSLREELKKAKEWAYKNLAGKKIYHNDISDFIILNKNGLSHAIYAKTYFEKIQLIYNTEMLIRSSVLYSIEKDKAGRKDIKNIYKFVTNWKIKNKDRFVYIIVRETKDGNFFYDHGIIKEKP